MYWSDEDKPLYKHELNFNHSMDNNYIHYKVWDKLLIHYQTSTVEPLKFRNG